MKTYLYVLKIFYCPNHKALQNKQVSKQHTTILLMIAYAGDKGKGRGEIRHTLILDFRLVPVHPCKGLGTNSITENIYIYTHIYFKNSYTILFP